MFDKPYKKTKVVVKKHRQDIIPLFWEDIGYGPPSPDCYPKQPFSYSYHLMRVTDDDDDGDGDDTL